MFKQALFESNGREIEAVETPSGKTHVRCLTVKEKDAYDVAARKSGEFRALLLVACCCNEDGEPEFDEFDVGRINQLPVWKIEPIIDAAMKINRFNQEDAEAIRKNSAPIPSANST